MGRKKAELFKLPDYTTSTNDFDRYVSEWQNMAKPIEQSLGLTLTGFDPEFVFTKGNPCGVSTNVTLPIWFVRDFKAAMENR